MKKLLNFLFSFPFMGFLLLILAFAMALATFVESSYGSEAAKGLIYNAFWFELIFALLGINLLANFFIRRLYTRQRLAVGLFHLAFVVIVIGAGITRYVGFEGAMHIREGESSDFILSSDEYLTIKNGDQILKTPVLFSELSYRNFDKKIDVAGRLVRIKSVGFVKSAVRTIAEDSSGAEMIDLLVSADQGRKDFAFSRGDKVNYDNIQFGYNQAGVNFQFLSRGDSLYLVPDRQLEIRSMQGGDPQIVNPNDTVAVRPMQLFAFGENLFVVKKFYQHAVMRVAKDDSGNSGEDAVILEVSDGSDRRLVNVFGGHGVQGKPVAATIGNTRLEFAYGAEAIKLPFSLQLNDFQLEKYPGSMSPSSFASELVLKDPERNVSRNVRVFMNNTLNYRGYKFFQSSYDQDEKGTVLSVNADRLGTGVTYFGYALLCLGIILALFSKSSYFHTLIRRLKEHTQPLSMIAFVMLLFSFNSASARELGMASIPKMDQTVVGDFSKLWVQGPDGRIEPVATLASEFLRKVSRQSDFHGRQAAEVMLGFHLYPELWQNVAMVKVSNDQLKELLGVEDSRIPLASFFDENGSYKLGGAVKAAYSKTPALRNMLEKEIINADERVNVCFMAIHGDMFTIFPGATREIKWFSPVTAPAGLPKADSLFVSSEFKLLKESLTGKGVSESRKILADIAARQSKFASGYLPSETKKKVEIFYNSVNPFKRVFPLYLLSGFVLLTVLFVNIFRQKTMNNKLRIAFYALIGFGFLIHTTGLVLRWYISGHAPWSDGYESMVYVSWAAMLAGMIFGRKYPMVIGAAAVLSGITLFVAHLNWMNPEITHLVPVLKSYWLLLHVAIITASYGFIGLSAFLGLLVLIFYCISNSENSKNIKGFVLQLTTINEMSVTLGLYMLTIGTFLGGIWANESWGSYWSWDPKETWALVTVVVYSFIAHMRLIPSLKGVFNYTVASVLGFSSVIMTYFGVNYYLSGMHSYGQGSVDSVHWSVFLVIAVIAAIMIVASYKQNNMDVDD